MDKNQIIGISLLVVLVIAFSIFNRTSEDELIKEQKRLDSLEAVENMANKDLVGENATTLSALNDSAAAVDSAAAQVAALEELYTLENEKMVVKISNHGGKVAFIQLKDYQRGDSTDLVLTTPGNNYFSFTYNNNHNTNELWFNKVEANEQSVVLTATIDGGKVTHEFNISENDFILGFESNWQGPQPEQLVWTERILQQEHLAQNERLKTSVYFKENGEEPDYVSERKNDDDEEVGEETGVAWISFKQQFFNQTLIPEDGFKKGYLTQKYEPDANYIKELHASMDLPQESQHKFRFIFAPNHYSTLSKYDIQLERVVNLGWGIFGWVNRFLVIPVFNLLSKVTSNYGIIILVLTILFKGVLLFFTYKSFLSGAKMRVLKPELDAIKKKFDGDMQAQQSEQMKLYQATGVSPFGGCLPMLVQMPILLALFNFFPNSFELRQKSFLWVTDLSSYDSVYDFGFNIPFYGDHISLFALLMTISTFVYTVINQSYQPPQQKELKYLPYIMPIVFLSFLNSYSAALSYYYFLANLMSIGQTFLFKAFVDEDKLRAQIDERRKNKGASAGGGGVQGKMQDWLEKQQRKQQALQQQQQKSGKKKK
ncbi:membrane protein insertase YidC [bacterium]|nr:membrane protein insertase YidC [bacterium]